MIIELGFMWVKSYKFETPGETVSDDIYLDKIFNKAVGFETYKMENDWVIDFKIEGENESYTLMFIYPNMTDEQFKIYSKELKEGKYKCKV